MDTTLWQEYRTTGSDDLREALLTRHLGLVHHTARGFLRRAPAHAELDDLVSAGTVGLLEAVDHFEPDLGLAFSTYAQPRIRGAILDDLRRRDPASRSQRKRIRQMDAARARLTAALGRSPQDGEVAQELGIPLETYWKWEGAEQRAAPVSLDQPMSRTEGREMKPCDVVSDPDAESPEDHVAREEEEERLRAHILALPEREREVLSLYFFEELKLREIAEIFGVTESRISQIRSQAIARLRERMGETTA